MCNLSGAVSLIVTAAAAIAAMSSAYTAHSTLQQQREAEKNKYQFIKTEIVLKKFQEILLTFAEINATAQHSWSTDRAKILKELTLNLRDLITVVSTLDPEIGQKLHNWRTVKDKNNDSIPRTVDYILGQNNSIIGEDQKSFMLKKAEELRSIQDELFKTVKDKQN